jgi:hypothetical protein
MGQFQSRSRSGISGSYRASGSHCYRLMVHMDPSEPTTPGSYFQLLPDIVDRCRGGRGHTSRPRQVRKRTAKLRRPSRWGRPSPRTRPYPRSVASRGGSRWSAMVGSGRWSLSLAVTRLRSASPRRCQSKLVRRSRRTGESKQHGSHSSTIRRAASCSGGTPMCRNRLVFSDSLARSFGKRLRAEAEIAPTLNLIRLKACAAHRGRYSPNGAIHRPIWCVWQTSEGADGRHWGHRGSSRAEIARLLR